MRPHGKHQRVVQVGLQRRSTPHLKQAIVEVIQEGKLGKIGHVEICCYYGMGRDRTAENAAPPAHLDYDFWTGPAGLRPFNPIMHPKGWRMFWEYGNGIVGDMCVHMLDMVRWMLDLGLADGDFFDRRHVRGADGVGNVTDTQVATFQYPDFNIVWTHRAYGNPADPQYPWAAFIYGERGTLKASVTQWDFIPRGKGQSIHRDLLKEFDRFPQDLKEPGLEPNTCPANRRHQQDFLRSIADRGRPASDIEEGHISSASCILANLSMKLGRPLQWDATSGQVVDDHEANARLLRYYRAPWVHPGKNGASS